MEAARGSPLAKPPRGPGRVPRCISEGKTKPDALVGEGKNAKINVAVATRQLHYSLDVGQLTGNSDKAAELPPVVNFEQPDID